MTDKQFEKAKARAKSRVISVGIDIVVDKDVDTSELVWFLSKVTKMKLNNGWDRNIEIVGCQFQEDVTDEYIRGGLVLE